MLRWHYRYCDFCGETQFDYGGKWTPERTFGYFIEHFSGKTESYDITILAGSLFEFRTYESWGSAFKVKLGDITYGPYSNFNEAEFDIENKLSKMRDVTETKK
jgi:hypothetical protein